MNDGGLVAGPGMSGGARGRRWSLLIGGLIGLAGIAYVVRTLIRDRDTVARALSQARPGLLVIAFLLAALGMTGIGFAWHTLLRILGSRLEVAGSLRGYFVGQLGKYLPGGVWAVMGRGEWARSEGVPGAVAYTSVLMSMGSAYLAALLLTAVLVPMSGVLGADGDPRFLWILLLLPLGFALIHPRVLGSALRLARRITKRQLILMVPSWKASSIVVIQQLPSWLLIGTASLAISSALGIAGDPINVIQATVIAWIIGFLALPTPGGIGVREAVFVTMATSLPAGIAATVALIARLLFITVDASGAAMTTFLLARRKRRSVVNS
jgi:hypothetical protein